MRSIAALSFAALAIALTTPAYAGSGTSSNACGWSSSGWNAPRGAVVFNRSTGPVMGALNGVGEYRTHVMVSHGPGAWVTHSTMYTPGRPGWPTYCSTPLEPAELLAGYPGASQTNQGGIYTNLYGDGTSLEYIKYQRGNYNGDSIDEGARIADWLWSTMPYQSATSLQDSAYHIYRLKWSDGTLTNYGFYQYRDDVTVETGGKGWNGGIVCSTLAAYAQNKAGFGSVTDYAYPHSLLASGLNGLYDGVYNECQNSMGFWGAVGAGITCFEGLCDDAGDQVANCMAAGDCDTSSTSLWRGIRDNASATASSVSPDKIGCWSGRGPCTGTGSSVWGYDSSQTLSWNSGGNVYGCWF